MVVNICIFEDIEYKNLLPLVYFRPVYELKCGCLTLREKIEFYYNVSSSILHCRKYLADTVNNFPDIKSVNNINAKAVLFFNGRILANSEIKKIIPLEGKDALYIKDGAVLAARLSGENLSKINLTENEFINFGQFQNIRKEVANITLINYPWELINNNFTALLDDFNILKKLRRASNERKFKGVHQLKKKNILIENKVDILPNVVMDAENGPIYISKGVKILANVYIQGPVFIGKNTLVKSNAAIYQTTIGEVCKIGGEIDNSIIHSYTNKQHEGYLGHSYLASWINIGASTNNSDLKNNYGNVKVLLNSESVDTLSQLVGLIMGDHSKTAINTMFNTGTIVGVACNIFGSGFPKRYLPSFTWGGSDLMKTNNLKEIIESAEIVMSRRNISMTKTDKELFHTVFDLTKEERVKYFR
ncbi:MAG: hypothetical protein A2V66_03395 [Ignavibacteria bacterium RBG_13_36_8]|nr:MAG: hypothetical protein A2V66_03395 [Ignavibacteria bacterium RBG_13_36_8]